jgi:phosphate transport system substrate-binding protein
LHNKPVWWPRKYRLLNSKASKVVSANVSFQLGYTTALSKMLSGLSLTMLFGLASGAQAQTVTGAGATFPVKVYERWSAKFEADEGPKVVFQKLGSSKGVELISARKVFFGATDTPLSADELNKRKLVQIPTVVGGIVAVVNVPGIAPNELTLSGEVLADIFSGKITRWSDPQIAALNPKLKLPDAAIQAVVRADKSGSTEAFSKYLANKSSSFKQQVGAGSLPNWPQGFDRQEGNDGVVQRVAQLPGSVGYVSFDRANAKGVTAVKLLNAQGKIVTASEAAFRSAITHSDLGRKGNDTASLLDQAGDASWPITLATYVLLDAQPEKAGDVVAALRFFYFALERGDTAVQGTGFAPMPALVQAQFAARLLQVRPKDGTRINFAANLKQN